jgi:hypothetical protein
MRTCSPSGSRRWPRRRARNSSSGAR